MKTVFSARFNLKGLLIISLFVLVAGCGEDKQSVYQPAYSSQPLILQDQEFIFGIHPLHNPKRLHQVFGPVAEHLSNEIPGVRFKLEASRNYAAYDKKLYAGKFHIALPNPFQTVNSLKKGYRVFGKMSDDENFRGIILVRRDSGINKVADLKGKAVSFPAPTALAATMMPQYYLQTHGLDVMNDIDIRYVGSQESSIMNVMLGDTVAGATWPPPWRALSHERPKLARELKVIWQTEPLPNNGLVVRNDIDAKLANQIKLVLLNLHKHERGKQWLKRMELSKFEDASDQTYRPVVEFLERFHTVVRPIK